MRQSLFTPKEAHKKEKGAPHTKESVAKLYKMVSQANKTPLIETYLEDPDKLSPGDRAEYDAYLKRMHLKSTREEIATLTGIDITTPWAKPLSASELNLRGNILTYTENENNQERILKLLFICRAKFPQNAFSMPALDVTSQEVEKCCKSFAASADNGANILDELIKAEKQRGSKLKVILDQDSKAEEPAPSSTTLGLR